MSMLPLLALGAVLLLVTKKKKSDPVFRVVESAPPLKPLPVFNESQVFDDGEQAAAAKVPGASQVFDSAPQKAEEDAVFKGSAVEASKESEVPSLDAWGPSPPVVQAPVSLEPAPVAPVVPSEIAPAPVAPGQAADAAAQSPGAPIEEVVQADPVAAARELAAYVQANKGKGAKLGTRGAPSGTVKALQVQMGAIEADGVYGPQTRARGQSLGVSMPSRA